MCVCDQAVRLWSSEEVMEGGLTVLPMFFSRDKWDPIRSIVALVQLTVEYLVSVWECIVGVWV